MSLPLIFPVNSSRAGIGTCPEDGCRGFSGPVPLPLLMSTTSVSTGERRVCKCRIHGCRRASVERPLPTSVARGGVTPSALLEGAILIDRGEARAAAALFDSISRWVPDASSPSANARAKAWALTHSGAALALAGDTVRLTQLIDTVRVYGAKSGLARDRVLHHYLRGLLLSARGDWPAAEAELRRALVPPVAGYPRVNMGLARALDAQGRRDEARAVLRDALLGPFDGSGLYVSRSELRRRLAELEAR